MRLKTALIATLFLAPLACGKGTPVATATLRQGQAHDAMPAVAAAPTTEAEKQTPPSSPHIVEVIPWQDAAQEVGRLGYGAPDGFGGVVVNR